MSNDFFNYDGTTPPAHTRGLSSAIRAIYAAIMTAFDKMPDMTGNADELVVINSTATGLTSISTSSLILAATLPAQTGNAGKVITTDGSAASWTETLSKVQNGATDFGISNTDSGGAAFATNTLTTTAGTLVTRAGSISSAYGASLMWIGTAGPLTIGTSGPSDVAITAGNTVRTVYAYATGAQTHTVTPSVTGSAHKVSASHNSNQYAIIENTDAGASAVAGLRASSNAGSMRLEAASTALGGYGASTWAGAGKYVAGTQSGGGDCELWTNGVARVVVSDSSVNLTAGPGGLFIGGLRTISVLVIGNNVTGASIYSPVAHGHTRAPDIIIPYGILNGATQGYTAGDKASVLLNIVGTRANGTNVWCLQQTTPQIFHASTGVATTVGAGDLSMRVTCIWL
ncbi:MAG: hypothetical protein IPM06_18880 [Rhizobiales bacterium]|nr:hypothetical protein [Hyphomicrobiales bacterium]